jgi:hypothetical protein
LRREAPGTELVLRKARSTPKGGSPREAFGDNACGRKPVVSAPVLAGIHQQGEDTMAQTGKGQSRSDDQKHEKARDLVEDALDKIDKGNEKEADRLIEEAKKLDESAAAEVVQDLDEDAGSDPDAAKKMPG